MFPKQSIERRVDLLPQRGAVVRSGPFGSSGMEVVSTKTSSFGRRAVPKGALVRGKPSAPTEPDFGALRHVVDQIAGCDSVTDRLLRFATRHRNESLVSLIQSGSDFPRRFATWLVNNNVEDDSLPDFDPQVRSTGS
jgi:hypothetical protein